MVGSRSPDLGHLAIVSRSTDYSSSAVPLTSRASHADSVEYPRSKQVTCFERCVTNYRIERPQVRPRVNAPGGHVSLVKSLSVGNGDMYYIRHGSDNFTIIDCNLPEDRMGSVLAELTTQSAGKKVTRFISTHPDQDHIAGLVELDDHLRLRNFYCVRNAAMKPIPTADFDRYRELHDDPKKAYYIYAGCGRRWMNRSTEERGGSGLEILWPITDDSDFLSAAADAANGMTPNNISPILKYSLSAGASMLWLGDLETDFMEKILDKVNIPKVDILFAPHHGRDSGKVPKEWLKRMNPQLIVIGNAPSEYINYYAGYETLTQNSCGDVLFDVTKGKTRIYVGDSAYQVDYLTDEGLDPLHGLYYIGTLIT